MGHRPPRAIGQFSWRAADVGAECLRCGVVTVYCDWEALARFQERGWSVAVEEAAGRFRCICGSRDVRLMPVAIALRPRPIPVRPASLRPIYRESRRTLFRRGPVAFPDEGAILAAVGRLSAAIEQRRTHDPRGPDLEAALACLRPFCYETASLDDFHRAVAPSSDMHATATVRQLLNVILRQLGREPG